MNATMLKTHFRQVTKPSIKEEREFALGLRNHNKKEKVIIQSGIYDLELLRDMKAYCVSVSELTELTQYLVEDEAFYSHEKDFEKRAISIMNWIIRPQVINYQLKMLYARQIVYEKNILFDKHQIACMTYVYNENLDEAIEAFHKMKATGYELLEAVEENTEHLVMNDCSSDDISTRDINKTVKYTNEGAYLIYSKLVSKNTNQMEYVVKLLIAVKGDAKQVLKAAKRMGRRNNKH